MSREYEYERTTSRQDAATVLRDVADGVEAGTARLGEGYTRKHNAKKELRSVQVNASEAAVTGAAGRN